MKNLCGNDKPDVKTCKWALTLPISDSPNGVCKYCGRPVAPLPDWAKRKT